jgi:hypothetical protein
MIVFTGPTEWIWTCADRIQAQSARIWTHDDGFFNRTAEC